MLDAAFHWLRRLANPPLCVVSLAGGTARLVHGKATAAWVADCTAIAAEFGLVVGSVEAVRTWRGLGLRFSPDVPAACRQRFRNVFDLHRWRRG